MCVCVTNLGVAVSGFQKQLMVERLPELFFASCYCHLRETESEATLHSLLVPLLPTHHVTDLREEGGGREGERER